MHCTSSCGLFEIPTKLVPFKTHKWQYDSFSSSKFQVQNSRQTVDVTRYRIALKDLAISKFSWCFCIFKEKTYKGGIGSRISSGLKDILELVRFVMFVQELVWDVIVPICQMLAAVLEPEQKMSRPFKFQLGSWIYVFFILVQHLSKRLSNFFSNLPGKHVTRRVPLTPCENHQPPKQPVRCRKKAPHCLNKLISDTCSPKNLPTTDFDIYSFKSLFLIQICWIPQLLAKDLLAVITHLLL